MKTSKKIPKFVELQRTNRLQRRTSIEDTWKEKVIFLTREIDARTKSIMKFTTRIVNCHFQTTKSDNDKNDFVIQFEQ